MENIEKFEGRENEIKKSQQLEQEKLTNILKRFSNVSYRIYNSEISYTVNNPSQNRYYEIYGFPKYYLFLKECDYLGQVAISINADAIVFHDKSARGFGLLTNKILPILRLEKAMKEDKKPESFQLPDVRFYNPTDLFEEEKYKVAIRNHFNKYRGKRVIIFDESSGGGYPSTSSCVKSDGSETNRWNLEEICSGCRCDYSGELDASRLKSATRFIQRLVPEADFFGYIGGVSFQGGFDLLRTNDQVTLSTGKDYNIQDATPHGHETEDPEEIFVKQNTTPISPELTQHRCQIRKEHSKMAWELFQQIILKINPYHLN